MTAKAEIAEYSISTRFGGRKPIKRDRRQSRPATRDEILRQIEAVFRHNRWEIVEQAANNRSLGLEVKSLDDYTDQELKIILDDLEKYRMILYEE